MGLLTLPMDWSALHRVVLPTLGAAAASKIDLLVALGFFAITLFKLRRSLGESFFKWDIPGDFLAVLPKNTNDYCSMIPAHNS